MCGISTAVAALVFFSAAGKQTGTKSYISPTPAT